MISNKLMTFGECVIYTRKKNRGWKKTLRIYTKRFFIGRQRSRGNSINIHIHFGGNDQKTRLRLRRLRPVTCETTVVEIAGLAAVCARNVLTKTYLNGTIVNLTTEHHKSRFKRRRLSPVWVSVTLQAI
jgi:hypothetical protein